VPEGSALSLRASRFTWNTHFWKAPSPALRASGSGSPPLLPRRSLAGVSRSAVPTWRSGGSGLPFRTGPRKRGVPASGDATPLETRRCSWCTPGSGACALASPAARVPRPAARRESAAPPGRFTWNIPPVPSSPPELPLRAVPLPSASGPPGTAASLAVPRPHLASRPIPTQPRKGRLGYLSNFRCVRCVRSLEPGPDTAEAPRAQSASRRSRKTHGLEAQGGQDEEQAQHPPENTTRRSAPPTQGRALTRSPRAGAGRPRPPALAPSGSPCAASAPRGGRGGALPRAAPGSSPRALLLARPRVRLLLRPRRQRVLPLHRSVLFQRVGAPLGKRGGASCGPSPRQENPARVSSPLRPGSLRCSTVAMFHVEHRFGRRLRPGGPVHSPAPDSLVPATVQHEGQAELQWGFAPSQRSSVALGRGPTGSITATSSMRRTRGPTRNA